MRFCITTSVSSCPSSSEVTDSQVPCHASGNWVRSFFFAGIGSGKVTSTHPVIPRQASRKLPNKNLVWVMAWDLSKNQGKAAHGKTIHPKTCQIASLDQANHPGASCPTACKSRGRSQGMPQRASHQLTCGMFQQLFERSAGWRLQWNEGHQKGKLGGFFPRNAQHQRRANGAPGSADARENGHGLGHPNAQCLKGADGTLPLALRKKSTP